MYLILTIFLISQILSFPAPVMVSEPEHAKDRQGANIALVCEAEGYPIPNVEWTWTTVDGDTVYLPSTYRSQISQS